MKKAFIGIALALLLLTNFTSVYSQADVAGGGSGHTWATTFYCGWDNTSNHTFDLKNEANQPINFETNTGAGNFTPLRMTITGGGLVGIGTAAPSNLLDVFSGSGNPQFRISYDGTHSLEFLVRSTGHCLIDPENNGAPKNLGIGDAAHLTGTPGAKLEVLDGSGAQLRLSRAYNSKWADFTVDGSGNLIIAPTSSNGSVLQNVGIHTTSPTATLHVLGNTKIESGSLYQLEILYDGSHLTDIGTNSTGDLIITPTRNVSIGTATPGTDDKFTVIQTGNSKTAAHIESGSLGIELSSNQLGTGGLSIGERVTADGVSTTYHQGINTTGKNSTGDNYGIVSYGIGAASCASHDSYGGYFAGSDASHANYGVYATASGSCTNVSNYAGYFSGNLYASTYLNLPSDENLKSNVEPITDALTSIDALNPVSYNYNTADFPQMNLPGNLQYGFLAQEVQSVFPNVVDNAVQPSVKDADGNEITPEVSFMTVKVGEILPVAIKGIQELKGIIEQQQQQIADLQSQLNDCCGLGMRSSGSGNEGISNQMAELKNSQSPFLGQSVPNPHSTQATIPYFIPIGSLGDAKIIFTDQLGREVNTVDIVGRGQGQLTVMTSQLEDGIYSYSLVVDGKVIDTKKMVKGGH